MIWGEDDEGWYDMRSAWWNGVMSEKVDSRSEQMVSNKNARESWRIRCSAWRVEKIVVEWVTVVKFRVNDGGGGTYWTFEVRVWAGTLKMRNMKMRDMKMWHQMTLNDRGGKCGTWKYGKEALRNTNTTFTVKILQTTLWRVFTRVCVDEWRCMAHPNMFAFLGHLQRTSADTEAEIERTNRGVVIRRAKHERQAWHAWSNVINDARIKTCITCLLYTSDAADE